MPSVLFISRSMPSDEFHNDLIFASGFHSFSTECFLQTLCWTLFPLHFQHVSFFLLFANKLPLCPSAGWLLGIQMCPPGNFNGNIDNRKLEKASRRISFPFLCSNNSQARSS